MKCFALLIALFFTCFSSVSAQDSPSKCWDGEVIIDVAYVGEETLSLFNLPNGNGSSFTEAQLPSGDIMDATISMIVLDCFGEPLASYPAEDMWLESLDGGLIPCAAGTIPDVSTDENGATYWADPMMAGGFTQDDCQAIVMGIWVPLVPIHIIFNSADLSGDLLVNLVDISLFSEVYFGSYDFSADLYRDGEVNIADVARLAQGVGTSCP